MKKLALLLALLLVITSIPALAKVNKTGLPITDEKSSFTLFMDDSGEADKLVWFPYMEEATNVHVDLQIAPYQVQTERLAVVLSTGDYAEVIAGWLLGRKDILELGMGEGTFLPLEDLIKEYAPNIEAILNLPGIRESMTLPDGHIYTFPYALSAPMVAFKPYINQQWLENVGMAVPTTVEEFKAVLIAFRDQDANGNGDPNDEIPFSGDPVNLNLGKYAGWFGVDAYGGGDYPYFAMVDGKMEFAANKPEYKAFIEYFADLYKEKLIDPELFTQDSPTWKAKAAQDLYGVTVAYGPGDLVPDYVKGTPEREKYGENIFTTVPVLTGGTENPIFHRDSYGNDLLRTQAAITDKATPEQAAIIVRWFDYLFDPEVSVQSANGPLGVTIEKVEDNVYRKIDQTDWTEEKIAQYEWNTLFAHALPRYYGETVVLPPDADEPDVTIMDIGDEMYAPFLNETFKKVWTASEEDAARASILSTDINEYVKSKMAQWVSGEADVNAEWDAYVAQLDTLGLAELQAIHERSLGLAE